MRRSVVHLVMSLAVIVAAILPVQVAAADTETAGCPNTIITHLWEGINLATGANYGCTSDTTAASPTDIATASSQPSNRPSIPANSTGTYVALGDSVAAGVGLPAAPDTDPACGVSTQAYPTQVAAALRMPYRNLACSGATVGDLFTEQHLPNTTRDIEPQLTTAFANGTPSLITITAGANDVYWQYLVRTCYLTTCGTNADETIVSGLLSILNLKLAYALADIDFRSGGQPPTVILTGYYQPFSAACIQQQTNITADELAWLNRQTDTLNQTLANAAGNYSFAHYAPVNFSGHELCSTDSWIQGPNDTAPFHPTATGQQAIAEAVLAQVR